MSDLKAGVSFLPCQDGDGYSWGGGIILTIGERSFFIGTNRDGADEAFAREIARRWNAAIDAVLKETEQ